MLATWNNASLTFESEREINGLIPYLVPFFREPARSTSRGFLYPVLTTLVEGELELVMMGSDGQPVTVVAAQ